MYRGHYEIQTAKVIASVILLSNKTFIPISLKFTYINPKFFVCYSSTPTNQTSTCASKIKDKSVVYF